MPALDPPTLPRKPIYYGDNTIGFLWKLYMKDQPKGVRLCGRIGGLWAGEVGAPLCSYALAASQIQIKGWCTHMRWLIFILIGVAVFGCRPMSHRTQVDLGDEVLVSLIATPMFSLQSDWHRKLTIETPAGNLEADLVEDTGWWRGSNLYRHSSGVYVLHEGQAGCVEFRTAPTEWVSNSDISCDKSDRATDVDAAQADATMQGFPASRFYIDLQYIGQFVETPERQEAISFIGAEEQPEAELPDIF